MAGVPPSKSRATRLTRGWQAASMVVVGGIATVGILGPKREPMKEPKAELPVVAGVLPGHSTTGVPLGDASGAAARFLRVKNAPIPPAPVDTTPITTAPSDGEPTPSATPVRYLGLAQMGAIRMALVLDQSKQRFIAEGAKIGEQTLSRVEPEAIVLKASDGTETRVDRTERSGEATSRARPRPISPVTQAPDLSAVAKHANEIDRRRLEFERVRSKFLDPYAKENGLDAGSIARLRELMEKLSPELNPLDAEATFQKALEMFESEGGAKK